MDHEDLIHELQNISHMKEEEEEEVKVSLSDLYSSIVLHQDTTTNTINESNHHHHHHLMSNSIWDSKDQEDYIEEEEGEEDGGEDIENGHSKHIPSPHEQKIQQLEAYTFCHTCKIVRPLRAKHCAISGRCIRVFDHYCPFVYNAVGQGNFGYFMIFLLATGINILLINIMSAYLFYMEFLRVGGSLSKFLGANSNWLHVIEFFFTTFWFFVCFTLFSTQISVFFNSQFY